MKDDWAPADEVRVLIQVIRQVEVQRLQLKEIEESNQHRDLVAARLRAKNKDLTKRLYRLETVVDQLLSGHWRFELREKPSIEQAALMLASVCDGAVFDDDYEPVKS